MRPILLVPCLAFLGLASLQCSGGSSSSPPDPSGGGGRDGGPLSIDGGGADTGKTTPSVDGGGSDTGSNPPPADGGESDTGSGMHPVDSGTPTDGGSGGQDSSTAPGDGGVVVASGQWVMGYYVGYDINAYPIASIDWSGLTHIIFSPLTVNSDLSLNLTFSDQNGTGEADAKALAQAAHSHGVKALLMLGGAGSGANIATAAAPAKLAAFVKALVSAMTTLGYDGIDLDWEDSVNLPDLVSLAQALRAAQPGIVLTYPGGAINANYQTVDPSMATLAESLDRFDVQMYYPSTATTGAGWDSWFLSPLSGESGSTPIATDDTLKRYVAAGIPKSKLGMGTAFYAICYTGGITGPRQPTTGSQQIVGGDNTYPLSAFFASGSTFATSAAANQMRDTTAAEPYLTFASPVNDAKCGAATQYVSYEDETSLIAKGKFSKANGYGGIIIWTIQEGWLPSGAVGGRAPNSLMQALKTGFIDP
jgi:chitinase